MTRGFYAVVRTDLKRLLKTPLVYILTAGYVLISGFFFFSLLKVFNPFQRMLSEDTKINLNFNTGVIQPLFETQSVVLLFIIPFITMRSFAEEKQSGSLMLLLTTPITTSELIFAKFISTSIPVVISVVLGFAFPLSIMIFGDPEYGPVLTGGLGLILFSVLAVSLGLFVSVLSPSQTIAGIFTLVLGIMWLLLDLPLTGLDGSLFGFIKDIALTSRLSNFFKGIISFGDTFFFIGGVYLFLLISNQLLSIKREE